MRLGKRVEDDADGLAVAIGARGRQDHQAAAGKCLSCQPLCDATG
jgi:hypothetical protein